eukprot:COSAG06_NODE_35091_length_464_cov_2.309589_2_plen_54_part_01
MEDEQTTSGVSKDSDSFDMEDGSEVNIFGDLEPGEEEAAAAASAGDEEDPKKV